MRKASVLIGGMGFLGCCLTANVAHATLENDAKWQLALCWSAPTDAPPVEVKLDVNEYGVILKSEIVDKDGKMGKDPLFHQAADAVLKAVNDPKCSTLTMPEDKYNDWKRLDLTFDPKDLL